MDEAAQSPADSPDAPAGITATSRPKNHRVAIIAVVVVVVVALVGGLTSWLLWPKSVDRRPFQEAITSLASAQAITYQTSVAGVAVDSRVTSHGDSIGTMRLAGIAIGLLSLGGKNYVRLTTSQALPGLTGSGAALDDRWVAAGASPLAAAPQSVVRPAVLAQRLRTVLGSATGFAKVSNPVDDVSALVAHAPQGDLYISAKKPYRVIRYAPRATASISPSFPSLPSLPDMPSMPSLPSLPSLPDLPSMPGIPALPNAFVGAPQRHAAPAPAAEPSAGGIDVTQLPPTAVDQTYNDLETGNQQLSAAVDPTVRFTGQAHAAVECGGACTVTAHVTDELVGTGETKVRSAQISAQMTATIMVDGDPAGECASAPTPIRPNGSTELTCADADAGALAQTLLEEKKEEAGPDGGTVSVAVTGEVDVQATAEVQAAIEEERSLLEQQRMTALGGRAPPPASPTGVRIGPVNLGMRESGTTNPVTVSGLDSPWGTPGDRLTIEDALGGNMPAGNRVIDTYVADDGGTAISVKTIDWRGDTYRLSPSGIFAKGLRDLKEVVNYRAGIDLWNPRIDPKHVSVWVLQMAYPENPPAAFLAQYQKLLAEGAKVNVTVQLIPIA
jgi:hypothetical protein